MAKQRDLVVAANRLPVHRVGRGKSARWETSPGGLVSALQSVLPDHQIAWVGWTGSPGRAPRPFRHDRFQLYPIGLSTSEVEHFYRNFSNRTLWPLYHDAIRPPEYHRHWWRPYVAVNQRFANAVADVLAPKGTAWIHDYHLQLVPGMLRELRPDAKISFFLHIPFPPVELFAQIPWRRQILRGILGADLAGFQVRLGAQNFARLARRYAEASGTDTVLTFENRRVAVEAIPISIDVNRFEDLAASPEVRERAEELKQKVAGRRILLGVDRLDYTKGIDMRLRALDTLFENHPEYVGNTVFVQVAVPSREYVPHYEEMRRQIEQQVGHINGTFGEPGRVPVHYLYRSFPAEQLVSYYLAADVMVVTPFRDGMNLVAKEYVACRLDDSGVLILSEFTGSAKDLRQALQVNPHNIDRLAGTLDRALRMSPAESRKRMRALRRSVRNNDVFRWARRCLRMYRP